MLPIPPGTKWWDVKPIVLPQERAELKVLSTEKKTRRSTQSSVLCTQYSAKPAGLWFGSPRAADPQPAEKPKKARPPKAKNDPKFVAAARELRDRYLDEVNAGRCMIEPVAAKYDVGRIADTSTTRRLADSPIAALPIAA